MGMRAWFGKSILKLLKETKEHDALVAKEMHDMERMFGSASACMVAFRINNGYVIRTSDGGDIVGHRQPGFTYCKDHQAIAD
jgi:hypothetical protein